MLLLMMPMAAQAQLQMHNPLCEIDITMAKPIEFESTPPALLNLALENAYPLSEAMPDAAQAPGHAATLMDINYDGIDDVFVWIEHSDVCGSAGCKVALYLGQGDGKHSAEVELFNASPGQLFVLEDPDADFMPVLKKSRYQREEGQYTLFEWEQGAYWQTAVCQF